MGEVQVGMLPHNPLLPGRTAGCLVTFIATNREPS